MNQREIKCKKKIEICTTFKNNLLLLRFIERNIYKLSESDARIFIFL